MVYCAPASGARIGASYRRRVYSSLTIGVFVGMVIYTFTIDGVGFGSLVDAFCLVPQMMGEQIANNGALLLFLALLGALVVLIAIAGGSRAYGAWVSQHVKSARLARVMTAFWAFSFLWTTISTALRLARSCSYH